MEKTPRSASCDRPCFHRTRSNECIVFAMNGPGACLQRPPMSPEEIRQAFAVIDGDAAFHRRPREILEVRHPAAESGTALGSYRVSYVEDDA